MKSDFIGSLVNRAAVALVFAATALSVSASQIPTDLSLDASRGASSSSVVAGPEAFNIPCGLNGLGEDMYLSIVAHMANSNNTTYGSISSFIMTSKRMSGIAQVLSKGWSNLREKLSEERSSLGKEESVSLVVLDKACQAMLEYQDSKIENRKMTKNPKLFLKFCKYWLENADGRRIMQDVLAGRVTDEVAYNDFCAFIEGKKQKAMEPLDFCILNSCMFGRRWNNAAYTITNADACKWCEEQFDAWLEEDDVAFAHVMQETMSEGEFSDYVRNFTKVLFAIRVFFNFGNLFISRSLFEEMPGPFSDQIDFDQIDSKPKLKRFLLEFFFKKINVSVCDFVEEEKMPEFSFMHLAARYSQIEALEYALENGVDIDKQIEGEGFTPLMCAVNSGTTKAVDFLLRNGANPYIKDAFGKTALDLVHDDDIKGFKIRTILEAWMRDHPENTYPAK